MNGIIQVKSKACDWRELVEAQMQSGQSIRVYCEGQQLNRSTFYYWKQKFKRLKVASLQGRFIPISKKVNSTSRSPRIYLPNGVQIDLGEQVGSAPVNQLIQKLCGVSNPPKDGHSAKS